MRERVERQIGSLLSVIEVDRGTDRVELKQEIRHGQEHMQEIIRTNQEKMEAMVQSIWSGGKNVMRHINHKI
jgi:hypothetical protein